MVVLKEYKSPAFNLYVIKNVPSWFSFSKFKFKFNHE